MNVAKDTIDIEYHSQTLSVHTVLLGDPGQFRQGMLFQFLGELEKVEDKVGHPYSTYATNTTLRV